MTDFENDVFQLIINHQSHALEELKGTLEEELVDLEGRSPLQIAMAYKNLEVCDFLIKNLDNLDHQDFAGLSALHFAAAHDDLRHTKLLLSHRANINISDVHGNAPLWTAVLKPYINYELVSELINGGANWNLKNLYSLSPLDMAVRKEDSTLLELFS